MGYGTVASTGTRFSWFSATVDDLSRFSVRLPADGGCTVRAGTSAILIKDNSSLKSLVEIRTNRVDRLRTVLLPSRTTQSRNNISRPPLVSLLLIAISLIRISLNPGKVGGHPKMTGPNSIGIRRKQVHEMMFDAPGLLQRVATDKGCFIVVPNDIGFNHAQRRGRKGRKPIPYST